MDGWKIASQQPSAERIRPQELEALFNIATTLVQSGNYAQKATRVLEELDRVFQADSAMLWVPDRSDEVLRLIASAGANAHRIPPTTASYNRKGITVMAAVQKKNIIVNDYRSHPSALARQIQRGMQSVAAFPIMREDVLLGILTITSKQRDHFTPDRVRVLAAVTHELSTLLENTRLAEEVAIQRELEDRQKKFISIASHELRTPMAVISGYTELLIERDLPATTQKESLHRIFRNTRALTKLVDDLLNVTRIQSGSITISPEPLIFRDVVEEVLASIRLDYDGSDFVIDTPPGLPLIHADRSKLSQVMANLLENAVKCSPSPVVALRFRRPTTLNAIAS